MNEKLKCVIEKFQEHRYYIELVEEINYSILAYSNEIEEKSGEIEEYGEEIDNLNSELDSQFQNTLYSLLDRLNLSDIKRNWLKLHINVSENKEEIINTIADCLNEEVNK